MKYLRILLLLCIAELSLRTEVAQANDEDAFLGEIYAPSEQAMGHGRSAVWTLHLVATQYQPSQPTPAMQAALQAQHEGRFLDALILLDEAGKKGGAGADTEAEMNLLRSSFLLQGNQSRQAMEILAPLLAQTQYAADAYALTAMAHLQQGQMQEALDAAQHAQGLGGGILPHLVLSYALQGMGRLAEAREVIHGFNTRIPQSAVALAREAELALTLDQIQSARVLVDQAHEMEATHPYVIAVRGLVCLIDGHAREAKAAFETVLQHDPKDVKALLGLGLAEIKLGNFQAGQEKLQAANEADPGNALILTYLGRSQQQLGQTEAAMASWHSAQQADPKDPIPWLYQAQAELQANRPLDARESLRQAQALTKYRQVYRGENLLRKDEQLLQANLAEIQRQLGLESLAFHTLSDSASEKNAANLRDQADVLQGQRFGESARRSLLLQSQFNDVPGNLPAALDIYGDGAGQTGAATPQHGVVSGLSAQQASYNNYDELFSQRTTLKADATTGSQNTNGEQIRLGVGSDTLGLSIAQLQFKTDGFAPFENLDNRVGQGIVQWRPTQSTQAFVSSQTFGSQHGETFWPGDPVNGNNLAIEDNSRVTRLGLRHTLTDDSELRGLWSHQQTDQTVNTNDLSVPPNYLYSTYGSTSAHSEELQYRRSGATYATQWGVLQTSGQINYWYSFPYSTGYTQKAQQLYAAWQQTLNPYWQLDAGLGWGSDKVGNAGNSTSLQHWLPKLGVVYTPDSGTHLRLAAWQGMGVFALGDATLAPVSLAGVLLTRPGDNGNLVHAVSLDGDRQLSPAWLLDAQTQRRMTGNPAPVPPNGQYLIEQHVTESRLALHWQPEGNPWTLSLAYDYERIQNDPIVIAQDSVDEQSLRSQQLDMRWFASARWTANLAWSHNQVTGTQKLYDASYNFMWLANQDSFNQVDADLSWKFNGSRDVLTAGVRNATDTRFQYADIDKLNPRFSNGRLVYAKLKLAW
jgi:Flp pilus assembly protein TadD